MNVNRISAVPAHRILAFLDREFSPQDFPDDPRAVNGIQLSPPPLIRRVASAVDLCLTTVRKALSFAPDLLLVHHGMLWEGSAPWIGERYETLRLLIEKRIGVYSLHLPLDAHPRWGNNILLAQKLKLRGLKPFGSYRGRFLGWMGEAQRGFSREKAERCLGFPIKELVPPQRLRVVAVVSGNGKSFLREAYALRADLYFTGEVDHHAIVIARDLNLGLWAGGHYETETLGVKAVGELLERKFRIQHQFISDPPGA